MIPAYDEKRLATFGHRGDAVYLRNYVTQSTKASNPWTVCFYILRYLRRYTCGQDVREFLCAYLFDWRLLSKTHVVSDGSYRSCCILVRPDGVAVSGDGGYGEQHGWGRPRKSPPRAPGAVCPLSGVTISPQPPGRGRTKSHRLLPCRSPA